MGWTLPIEQQSFPSSGKMAWIHHRSQKHNSDSDDASQLQKQQKQQRFIVPTRAKQRLQPENDRTKSISFIHLDHGNIFHGLHIISLFKFSLDRFKQKLQGEEMDGLISYFKNGELQSFGFITNRCQFDASIPVPFASFQFIRTNLCTLLN